MHCFEFSVFWIPVCHLTLTYYSKFDFFHNYKRKMMGNDYSPIIIIYISTGVHLYLYSLLYALKQVSVV